MRAKTGRASVQRAKKKKTNRAAAEEVPAATSKISFNLRSAFDCRISSFVICFHVKQSDFFCRALHHTHAAAKDSEWQEYPIEPGPLLASFFFASKLQLNAPMKCAHHNNNLHHRHYSNPFHIYAICMRWRRPSWMHSVILVCVCVCARQTMHRQSTELIKWSDREKIFSDSFNLSVHTAAGSTHMYIVCH